MELSVTSRLSQRVIDWPPSRTEEFLGLDPKELDKPIYRIFSFQRFLEVVASRSNTLVKPAKWDDPFENYVLSAVAKAREGAGVRIAYRHALYGQCWTFQRDSDAMWRIYSPDKHGVRVRTTPRKLYQSMYAECRQYADLSCFIGKVRYLSQHVLLDLLSRADLMTGSVLDPTGAGQAATLLIKRKEFAHEREVRLIHLSHTDNLVGDLYRYTADPLHLFNEVAFDPRLSPELFGVYSQHVHGLGYQKGSVIQSPLYRLPALALALDGV